MTVSFGCRRRIRRSCKAGNSGRSSCNRRRSHGEQRTPEAIAEAERKLTTNTERLSANLSKPETPKSQNTWQTIEEKWKKGKNSARNAFFGLMGASAVGLGGTILLNESLPSTSDAFTSGLSPERFEFLSNLASTATTGRE